MDKHENSDGQTQRPHNSGGDSGNKGVKYDWWDEMCKAHGEKNFWEKKKRKHPITPKKRK